jgi:signal transduction histidine kinase
MTAEALELLRSVSLFSELDEEDLETLCEGSGEVSLPAGERLFDEGDYGDDAFVVMDGIIEITKRSANREILVAVRNRGDVIGEMAPLESTLLAPAPRSATVRARTDSRLLVIQKESLDEVLDNSPKGSRSMFGVLLRRWRETESLVRHSDRMAQLGTLSAGLAHEINNPASAVKRAAEDLPEAVEAYAAARERFAATGVPDSVASLLERMAGGEKPSPPPGSPIARSDAESAVEEWLDGHGVPDAWEHASTLVAAGIDAGILDGLGLTGDELLGAVALLTAAAAAQDLIHVVGEGATRVSSLVKSMKDYSYLDRAPVQDVLVTKGIDDTLLIMRSKLKDIELEIDYEDGIPEIPAHGSELNQVWTNLVDNAIDAIAENGGSKLAIRAALEDDTVVVEISDDGGGIPPDVQPRIFDAFFTTKPPGKGTGQGLGITFSIVTQSHGGNIFVKETGPEGTTFRVELPVAGPPE